MGNPRRAPYALVAIFFTASISIHIGRSQTLTEYPLLRVGSGATGIAAGPDGALWFTEQNRGTIGRITTSGVITEYAIPPSAIAGGNVPHDITAGTDGALWFGEIGAVGRINTSGATTHYPIAAGVQGISPGAEGVSITVGPDGALWFVESITDTVSRIGRIDTSGKYSSTYGPAATIFTSITAGPDGLLWIGLSMEPGRPFFTNVRKINVNGAELGEYASAENPVWITAGPDGALWYTGNNFIWRITTDGLQNAYAIPTAASAPGQIIKGPDGALWFTETAGNKIGRITTAGAITEYALPGGMMNPLCGPQRIAVGPDGALWFTENCRNAIGRLELPSGGAANLAFGKPAAQSSTLAGLAGAAVDGIVDGNFYDRSVTATNADANAWWQVDLGAPATINSVVVWNRTDCCSDRLTDYWVFVSNTPFLHSDTPATLQNRTGTFASHQTTAPSPSATINFGGVQGQYVRIQLSGANYLSLAEVQVMGTGGSPPPTNLALHQYTLSSSVYPGPLSGPGASAAVDGVTDGNYFDGWVASTNADPNAWWEVDLGAPATVSSIVIYNRTDCCSDRLSDYWVFVSNTPFLSTDTPAALQNRAGTFASHRTTAPSPSTVINVGGAQGQYVRIQLSGTNYLSLAEVQVMGTILTRPTNLSMNKPATQSSTLPNYASATASSAVDGKTDGNFFDNSVTTTNADANAWWQVDLGASATVNTVVIWNRTDCCSDRLSGYWVFVSNTPFLSTDTPATLQNRAGTFASFQATEPAPSANIPVNAPGRYVRVQLSGTNYLSLAEVQVFGQ